MLENGIDSGDDSGARERFLVDPRKGVTEGILFDNLFAGLAIQVFVELQLKSGNAVVRAVYEADDMCGQRAIRIQPSGFANNLDSGDMVLLKDIADIVRGFGVKLATENRGLAAGIELLL